MQTQLNPPQWEAVHHTEGPLLILAGAGSGKTRVITHRIAHLIRHCGVLPEQILAVTFTNKAAAEMRQRVHALLGTSGLPIWLSTFHAACAQILRREATHLKLSPHFVIYDSSDQLTLIKQCVRALQIDDDLYAPQSLLRRISALKNDLIDHDAFSQEAASFGFDAKVAEVYPLYQKRLRENGAVDFDDLVMQTALLLRRYPPVLGRYQRRFRYILVDEYQDTNMAQYHLLHLLAAQHRNLCVVGDDDQSVYRFRGANVHNILNFERDYPEARVIKLEQNYRSSATIVEAATTVVAKNPGRREKTLWTENARGVPIGYCCAEDELHEAEILCETLRGLHRTGEFSYRDFAIFYRTNAQSRVLEDGLRRTNIPYRVVGGLRFYDRQEVKDVLAYLRLLVNPLDTVSLRRIINVPRRGIGAATWERLEELAISRSLSGLEALRALGAAQLLGKSAHNKVMVFAEFMRTLANDAAQMGVADLTREVLTRTGYVAALESDKTVEAQTRLENLGELVNAAAEFERSATDTSLQAFVEHTALISDQDTMDESDGAAVLMTLHASKGLEFPVVCIAGMEDGLFPHGRSFDDAAQMEEERRLCYVGMTRARQRLYLTSAMRRRIYGVEQSFPPSMFLADIPPACLHDYSVEPALKQPERPQPRRAQAVPGRSDRTSHSMPRSANTPFAVGTQVQHQQFGRGVIQRREGDGEELKLTIIFRDHGVKKVLAKFAQLRAL